MTDNTPMTTQRKKPKLVYLRQKWHTWRTRPRLVTGGNYTLYPLDNRTYEQRREAEMLAMIYIMTQNNNYMT